jgi:ABC-type transporter Mla subunit MlaD
MKLEKNELRVGVFIVIPLVIMLLFVVLKLGYSSRAPPSTSILRSTASLDKGRHPGEDQGLYRGRVIDIKPVFKPALHFLAALRSRRDIDIYEDCAAVIQNQNIIGDPVIDIRNPEKKGELVRAGSVIEGIEYVNLEAILQDVHALLATLQGTVGVIRDISIDSRSNLRTLLTNLSGSMATVNDLLMNSQKDILEILSSFRQTAKTMNEISEELKKHPVKFLFKGQK